MDARRTAPIFYNQCAGQPDGQRVTWPAHTGYTQPCLRFQRPTTPFSDRKSCMLRDALRSQFFVCLCSICLCTTWTLRCEAQIAAGNGAAIAPAGASSSVPTAIYDYVGIRDDVFAWEISGQQSLGEGKIIDVALTSQRWQNIVWKHTLQIFEPADVKYPQTVLLMVTGGRIGGKPDRGDMQRGLALAKACGGRVAVIHQVPNQPLLGDHVEDDLITETWLNYLETGDETWPLLFPMVKSAIRAMDAVQEISKEQWTAPVENFVITGASKRGWTSWLTPVADQRVVATAPIVIDVLNFRAQMKHQLDTWGKYSDQIIDYSSKGLIVVENETEREAKLRTMMDPYTYREKLTLPKLLVNGTNDPYWVVDAMKWYWDDLSGPKYVLQVPNAGHGLDGGVEYALSTIAAFYRFAASQSSPPEIDWVHRVKGDEIEIQVTTKQQPLEVRLWSARSSDKDFRDEKWESKVVASETNTFTGNVRKPADANVANYMEFKYAIEGVPYSLCTLIFRD